MAITSKEINLGQLSAELGGVGLVANFNDPKKKIILAADGVDITDEEIAAAIDSHIAIDDAAAAAAAKQTVLDKLGLTAEEIAALLG